jgi:hypothetical protein
LNEESDSRDEIKNILSYWIKLDKSNKRKVLIFSNNKKIKKFPKIISKFREDLS